MEYTTQPPPYNMKKITRRDARECWKCPRNGKGDPYCWKECLGPAEVSNKGLELVSLDSMPAPSEYIQQNIDKAYLRAKNESYVKTTEQLEAGVERALVIILSNLMSLSDIDLCIFRHLFHGDGLQETADKLPQRMTKQAVHKRLKSICEKNKVVEKVVRGMMRRGVGGARATTTHLSLFDEMNISYA